MDSGPGTVIAGAVVSTTVTPKEPSTVLPLRSAAAHFTVVEPSANDEPDGGSQETGRDPSTESVAVGTNVTDAPDGPVASALSGSGSVKTGFVVSCTTSENDVRAVLPCVSELSQTT